MQIASVPGNNLHIFCKISFSGSLQFCHLSFNLDRNPIILQNKTMTTVSTIEKNIQVESVNVRILVLTPVQHTGCNYHRNYTNIKFYT